MTEWHLMTYLCSGEPYRRGPHPTLTAADGRQVAALTPTSSVPTSSPACSRCSRTKVSPVPSPTRPSPTPVTAPRNYGEVWRALKRLADEARRRDALPPRPASRAALGGHPRPPRRFSTTATSRARGHFVDARATPSSAVRRDLSRRTLPRPRVAVGHGPPASAARASTPPRSVRNGRLDDIPTMTLVAMAASR